MESIFLVLNDYSVLEFDKGRNKQIPISESKDDSGCSPRWTKMIKVFASVIFSIVNSTLMYCCEFNFTVLGLVHKCSAAFLDTACCLKYCWVIHTCLWSQDIVIIFTSVAKILNVFYCNYLYSVILDRLNLVYISGSLSCRNCWPGEWTR